eukprot:TRINITY_DN3791_c0_g2_i2.p1 TRINITY_DN3791_c0_g2~~TRINITY_DN3791_c0_g2_i2.p1  ORF type:complete len:397 (+),score=48.56 TRINITY_DN3791_c0_g2_i2:2-1192(+)
MSPVPRWELSSLCDCKKFLVVVLVILGIITLQRGRERPVCKFGSFDAVASPLKDSQYFASMRKLECSEAGVKSQADKFEHVQKGIKYAWMGCARLPSLNPFLSHLWDPLLHPIVLITIGAGKGHDVLHWLDEWAPHLDKNAASWSKHISETHKPEDSDKWMYCGICGDCYKKPRRKAGSGYFFRDRYPGMVTSPFRIYALEPNVADFELLNELKEWTGQREAVTVVHGMVSNASGIAKVPITHYTQQAHWLRFMSEQGDTANGTVDVRMWTVDGLLSDWELEHVHYLRIRGDGSEPLMLGGAAETLKAQRASLVEFEYNSTWQGSATLETVVQDFDAYGYDCFLEMTRTLGEPDALVCLTSCWHPIMEFRAWSNILCSSRREPALTAFLRSFCVWL